MEYALLIYQHPRVYDALVDKRAAVAAGYSALLADERVIGGLGLKSPDIATTVRVSHGETLLTDGPFANTNEVLCGFYLIEADDLDEAIVLASRVPAARCGGSVEIRPVIAAQR